MEFCWTTLHVSNLEHSLAFYRDTLGLPVDSVSHNGPVSLAMLGPENAAKLELLQTPEGCPAQNGAGVSIGLTPASLDTLLDTLRAQGIDVRGPVSPNPQLRFFFLNDPDGYEIQLVGRT